MIVVDTNVLIHSTALGSPEHRRAREALNRCGAQARLAVTRQILREYLAATTRPQTWSRALSIAEAAQDAGVFLQRFALLEDGPAAWMHLMELSRQYAFGGKQVHDANVVATMLAHGKSSLLTFNTADFRRFVPLISLIEP